MTLRKQKDNESDTEYSEYLEVRRLERKAYKKAYYDANKDDNKDARKAYKVKQRYGLTIEDYTELLSGGCQVCGSKERLHCDHNHATGLVRGCLCQKCNQALGLLQDSPTIIKSLLDYIEVHQNENC